MGENEQHKNPINFDIIGKVLGAGVTLVSGLFGAYMYIENMIKNVDGKVSDVSDKSIMASYKQDTLEKQLKEQQEELKELSKEVASINEAVGEVMRALRKSNQY